MTRKTPPSRETQEQRGGGPREAELVLRDESDEIIDNLKQQLQALQQQLHRYKGGGSGGDSVTLGSSERHTLDFGLTPHIAARLQVPAEELTSRLDRLIEQVDDPAIKAELEACRDSAFFLSDTFVRISEQHRALTDALTADALVMDAPAFRERLERSLQQRGLPVQVVTDGALPDELRLSPQSAITVLMTLAELAGNLFGREGRMTVTCPRLAQVEEGADTHLRLEITGDHAWHEVAQGEAVSTVAIRAGARTRAVVDLLYVEKIIEMRGGSLDFLRRDERVCGFTVNIPITLLKKAPRTAKAGRA